MACHWIVGTAKIFTNYGMEPREITNIEIYRPKFILKRHVFYCTWLASKPEVCRLHTVQLVLELSTVLALTQLGIRQSDWWRARIRSTNLHIVVECTINDKEHCSKPVPTGHWYTFNIEYFHGNLKLVMYQLDKLCMGFWTDTRNQNDYQ